MTCPHLHAAGAAQPQITDACQDCLTAGFTDWVRLRSCLTCGHVACCDSSPHRHATAHFRDSGHPVMRSIQGGESWRWCYIDEALG